MDIHGHIFLKIQYFDLAWPFFLQVKITNHLKRLMIKNIVMSCHYSLLDHECKHWFPEIRRSQLEILYL